MSLTDDQWLQASLPVRDGGLGLRHVSSLASSAFLASAAGTCELQDHIFHRVSLANDDIFDSCLLTRVGNGTQPPVDSDSHKQRTWDKVVVDAEYRDLLSRYSEPYHRRDCWQLQHLRVATGSTHGMCVRSPCGCRSTPWLHSLWGSHMSMWCHGGSSRSTCAFMQEKLG